MGPIALPELVDTAQGVGLDERIYRYLYQESKVKGVAHWVIDAAVTAFGPPDANFVLQNYFWSAAVSTANVHADSAFV